MKTFGEIISEARAAIGMSQKTLAGKVKKEEGEPISPQYLNDVEHDRRNPPSEYIIGQLATILNLDKDVLCMAAGTIPEDMKKIAVTKPEVAKQAIKAFRRKVEG